MPVIGSGTNKALEINNTTINDCTLICRDACKAITSFTSSIKDMYLTYTLTFIGEDDLQESIIQQQRNSDMHVTYIGIAGINWLPHPMISSYYNSHSYFQTINGLTPDASPSWTNINSSISIIYDNFLSYNASTLGGV